MEMASKLLSPTVYPVMIGLIVDSVDLKIRIGDWEVDMVVTDRGNKEVVLTLVEVRSGFILISKLPGVNRIAPHRKSLIC